MFPSAASWVLSNGIGVVHHWNWDNVMIGAAAAATFIALLIVPVLKWVVGSTVGGIVDREVKPRFQNVDAELHAIRSEVAAHGNRIARLEGMEEGRRSLLAAQAQQSDHG